MMSNAKIISHHECKTKTALVLLITFICLGYNNFKVVDMSIFFKYNNMHISKQFITYNTVIENPVSEIAASNLLHINYAFPLNST